MKILLSVCALVLTLLPSFSHAEELNAGFVEGLWYSEESVFAGEPVRIYVALRNTTEHDLTGTVRFADNGTRIGSSYVSALSGRLIEAWVDWTPTYGEHTVTAALSDVKIYAIGESAERVTLSESETTQTITVDYDTDGDGIGNEEDVDDDGDGVSDVDEKKAGTDPLVFDDEEEVENEDEEIEKDTESGPASEEVSSEAGPRAGLERYIGDGIIDDLLSNVTEKVGRSKVSLDEYREERNSTLEEKKEVSETESNDSVQSLKQPTELATITRSKIKDEDPGLIASLVAATVALLSGIYTFILWVLSGTLAHPALVQLALLLLILIIFYTAARRMGRRPPPN